jgi:hypothetical protein
MVRGRTVNLGLGRAGTLGDDRTWKSDAMAPIATMLTGGVISKKRQVEARQFRAAGTCEPNWIPVRRALSRLRVVVEGDAHSATVVTVVLADHLLA